MRKGGLPTLAVRAPGIPRHGLESRSKTELENRGREVHIHGRSKMSKAELVKAIRERE